MDITVRTVKQIAAASTSDQVQRLIGEAGVVRCDFSLIMAWSLLSKTNATNFRVAVLVFSIWPLPLYRQDCVQVTVTYRVFTEVSKYIFRPAVYFMLSDFCCYLF